MRKLYLSIVALAATALLVAGLSAAASSESYKIGATLSGSQEVPKTKSKGTGSFTGTVVEKGAKKTLSWKLTFKGLTGPAQAAHIHLGKRSVSGTVLVSLCGPCKSGAHGTAKVTEKIVKAIEGKRTYVNVHTARYPNGEIRGQISVK